MQRPRDRDTDTWGSGCWLVPKARERAVGGVARGQTVKILEGEPQGLGLQPGVSRTHKRALESM